MRFKWGFALFGILIVFLISVLVMTGYIYKILEIPLTVNSPSPEKIKRMKYNYIVVLSGGCRGRNILGVSSEKRLKSALELYKKNVKIVLAGNFICQKRKKTGKDFLRRIGIPRKDIVELEYSNSTIDDCRKAAEFLKKEKAKNPVVITSFYHTKRVKMIFSYFYKDNFIIYSSKIYREKFNTKKKRKRLLKLLLHEYGGIIYWYYKKIGFAYKNFINKS